MNLPEAYFSLSHSKWLEKLAEQRNLANAAKNELLSLDIEKLKADYANKEWNNKTNYLIAVIVYRYVKEAIFFPDQEAINMIKALNYKYEVLRWFISLESLFEQYELIRKHNIQIDTLTAWTFLNSFLGSKIQYEIFKYHLTTTHDNTQMTQLTKELILLRGRKKYSGSDPKRYKNLFEFLLNDKVKEFISIPIKEFNLGLNFDINAFIDLSKGKTESSFLRVLVDECFQYDEKKLSKTKFLAIIFDFIKLLVPDRNFMDEGAFIEAAHLTYKSYDSYKAHVLKKIIYPKGIQ